MKLEIDAPHAAQAGSSFQARAMLFNDSYDPVPVSRNAFTGPTAASASGLTPPAVEATFGLEEQPLTLQPFTFYGRERQIDAQQAGALKLTAEYKHDGQTLTAEATVHIE
ncbi:MAG TPA: hypothetical protein VER79_03195 [Candidatus Limnocylindrales bacterium]|nr:hypothetical protein [Candidatus Limnocylindrales bacterium]